MPSSFQLHALPCSDFLPFNTYMDIYQVAVSLNYRYVGLDVVFLTLGVYI